ncbi:hypothetical protein ACFOWX_11760 [Sphingorhabdus arenilitoris]|uniref:Uncharacterized protein n=1 Tax=Sphingorhabdus arenilitoris TaxID=1490041 RepID=A0ABV8RI94_9SPHN
MTRELLTDWNEPGDDADAPAGPASGPQHVAALLRAAQCDFTFRNDDGYYAALDAGLFWIDGHAAWMPVASTGAPLLPANSAEAAMPILDLFDPLLSRIEAAIGLPLDPATIAPFPQWQSAAGAYNAYHITLGDEAMILFIADNHPRQVLWQQAAALLPPDPATLKLPARLALHGGELSLDGAQGLAIGDWLLLPQSAAASLTLRQAAPNVAQHIEAIGCPPVLTGIFALHTGQFEPSADGAGADHMGSAGECAAWQFHTSFNGINADRLLDIAAGEPAVIAPLAEGQAGEIFIADRAVALGRILSLRDRMAVAVDEIYGDETVHISEQEG